MNRDGQWKLAPAYDVTYAFNPDSRWVFQHQMSVNGKRQNINYTDFEAVAKNMNIKKYKIIIEEVKEAVRQWPRFASEAGVPDNQIHGIFNTFQL